MTSESRNEAISARRVAVILHILKEYEGSVPLHRFLKQYFSHHRNFGSTDRRIYSAFVYSFFRMGRAMESSPVEQRLAVGAWLTQQKSSDLLEYLSARYAPGLSGLSAEAPLDEKLQVVKVAFPQFSVSDLVPDDAVLSGGMTVEAFGHGVLEQPLVWVRMRDADRSLAEAAAMGMVPVLKGPVEGSCAFAPSAALTSLKAFAYGLFEIQDLSSQAAGELIPAKSGETWWDCCCGAGGKSLQLADRIPGIHLTCTDVRASILENFRERIKRNKVRAVTRFDVLDLQHPVPSGMFTKPFDGIVADVPCSGSGTWSRTPERLRYFNEEELIGYHQKQLMILRNIWPHLRVGGHLAYVTCSVYKIENENVVNEFLRNVSASLVWTKLIRHPQYGADTMFVALIVKQDNIE